LIFFDLLFIYVPEQISSNTLHFLSFKGNTIWTGVVGPVMSLTVVFIDLYLICQKGGDRFLLIFFSVTEDIVLIEIMK